MVKWAHLLPVLPEAFASLRGNRWRCDDQQASCLLIISFFYLCYCVWVRERHHWSTFVVSPLSLIIGAFLVPTVCLTVAVVIVTRVQIIPWHFIITINYIFHTIDISMWRAVACDREQVQTLYRSVIISCYIKSFGFVSIAAKRPKETLGY